MAETVQVDTTRVAGASPGLTAYLAVPDPLAHGPGPYPGVVVVHEAFGVDDNMRRAADRLARAGYLTLLPDLFSEGGPRRCLRTTFAALRRGAGRPFQDVEAARAWLLGDPRCTGRVGLIGFCLGGGFALLSLDRGFQAVSANYGRLPRDLQERVRNACPVVASYGGRDAGLRGAADTLESALARAGVEHDVVEYPSAGHAFMDEQMPGPWWLQPLLRVAHAGPDPASAGDAWERIESFFGRHLSTGGSVGPAG
ncbi:MAG TPA: dienelactone hydrolase family protein [Dermatophilaceae bacterium]|nr:dienelactone hydrolase family protein [Dermatophilaceae bacterium]